MSYLDDIGVIAKKAKSFMNTLDEETRNRALILVANNLVNDADSILEANKADVEKARENGMHPGMLDRLTLTKERIEAIAEGVRQVKDLPDPTGKLIKSYTHANNMTIDKISVPFGVIGMIYESRPNVTVDAFALAFKSGNVSILKGGRDIINSNIAIVDSIKKSLKSMELDENAVILITDTDRAVTTELMKRKDYLDLLIPRGVFSLKTTFNSVQLHSSAAVMIFSGME